MTTYNAPQLTGYNSNPPPNDNSRTLANAGNWNTILVKLTNPLRDWITAILAENSRVTTELREAGTLVGEIKEYPTTTPPSDKYLPADGRAISRVTYAELFQVYGETHGAGDGSTTFNLPNKIGRYSRMASKFRYLRIDDVHVADTINIGGNVYTAHTTNIFAERKFKVESGLNDATAENIAACLRYNGISAYAHPQPNAPLSAYCPVRIDWSLSDTNLTFTGASFSFGLQPESTNEIGSLLSSSVEGHYHDVDDPGHNHTVNNIDSNSNCSVDGNQGRLTNNGSRNTTTETTGISVGKAGGDETRPDTFVTYYWVRVLP